jgi:hypothetical protein
VTTPGGQLSPDRQWWWNGAGWVPTRSLDGRWTWTGHRWQHERPDSVRSVLLCAILTGSAGVLATFAGAFELRSGRHLPPGWVRYQPPWTVPVFITGLSLVFGAVMLLGVAWLGYRHSIRRSTQLPS